MYQLVLLLIGGIFLSNKNVQSDIKNMFGPFQIFGPPTQSSIDTAAMAAARHRLIQHEGVKTSVYKDSRGFLTVGIGHKILPEDNLNLGDVITTQRVNELFEKDIQKAFAAAKSQARDLKKYTPEFIAALTDVNFQLGTGWPQVFYNTYNLLRQGNVETAIRNLRQSSWNQQTPVRVAAFISSIQSAFA